MPHDAAQFRVREALSCMQKCHQDQHLSLASVAKRAGVSPTSARNTRAKVRSDILARAAKAGTDKSAFG